MSEKPTGSPYVHLSGVIAGVVGSLLVYTLSSSIGLALIGGLAGVLVGIFVARLVLSPKQ
jgi:hypothetical protein